MSLETIKRITLNFHQLVLTVWRIRERDFAVCSQIPAKHINTLCGQNVELWLINLVVHIVTTGL